MLRYLTIPVTAFQQNCSLVWCDATRKAAVIDPGGDLETLLAEIQRLGLALEQIWLTHAHIDHAGGTGELAATLGLPIIGPHPGDQFWIDGLPQQSAMFGFPPAQPFTPTRWLHDGDQVQIGNETLNVRHCPGHTPGHVVFHAPQIDRAFVGDVLFAGSIGRTDFPQGNHQQLIDSITQRLWPMGDQTVFIPGHGPESTLRERKTIPGRDLSGPSNSCFDSCKRLPNKRYRPFWSFFYTTTHCPVGAGMRLPRWCALHPRPRHRPAKALPTMMLLFVNNM
jgi:glyoxylase-like metal-dependent hydrolase (beta-lactamase superfamily II)